MTWELYWLKWGSRHERVSYVLLTFNIDVPFGNMVCKEQPEMKDDMELECEHCGTPVDSPDELTQTKWNGDLCETCIENKVWK